MATIFRRNAAPPPSAPVRQPENRPDKVIIYASELEYLSRCILERPNIETGGNLFGLRTPFNIPFIYYVVGPGPQAVHNVTHFRQDFHFLERNANFLVDEHALHHIGSWHSHHSLGLTQPSGGDSESTLEGMRECGLNSFLLVIGNCRSGRSSVRPYLYTSDGRCEQLRWVILPGRSPIRVLYDRVHANSVYVPTGEAAMEQLDTASLLGSKKATPAKVNYPQGYWLNEPENRQTFSEIVKFLKLQYHSVKIFQKEDRTVELQAERDGNLLKIHFDTNFPDVAPKLYVASDSHFFCDEFSWHYDGNILDAVTRYMQTVVLISYDRLQLEKSAMSTQYAPRQFKFYEDSMTFEAQTYSGKIYTVKIALTGNYPEEEPKVFITTPKPLLTCDGQTMLQENYNMRTGAGKDGCVKLRLFEAGEWHRNMTLFKLTIRATEWLEQYEKHLKTGDSIHTFN